MHLRLSAISALSRFLTGTHLNGNPLPRMAAFSFFHAFPILTSHSLPSVKTSPQYNPAISLYGIEPNVVYWAVRISFGSRCGMRGYFISVEGGDGSGKSTQINKIEAYLRAKGLELVLTREPGGTPIAEKIRALILDPANGALTARAEMLLYAAARAQHVEEKILPALAEGKTVLCDRFVDSSIAYQGYGRGLGKAVAAVNAIATGGKAPDLTFFLDISPSAGMARKQQQNGHALDRLEQESLAFHELVYGGYLRLAAENPSRIAKIDATKPVDAVFAEIQSYLDRLLGGIL